MDFKSFNYLFFVPDLQAAHKRMKMSNEKRKSEEISNKKEKIKIILGLLFFGVVISFILIKMHLIFGFFILFLIMKVFIESVKSMNKDKYSQKDILLMYSGIAAIIASLLFFSSWAAVCDICRWVEVCRFTDYPWYNCNYPKYILSGQMLVFFYLTIKLHSLKKLQIYQRSFVIL